MNKIYFWILCSIFLHGETYTNGTFQACLTASFCATVTDKTLTHEFTSSEITTNASSKVTMGTFAVTIDDTTTMGGATHTVTVTSRYMNGTTMQLQRFLDSGLEDLSTQADLVVTDDTDVDGNTSNSTLVNNTIMRQRDPADGNITAEVHTITIEVAIGELDGAKTGRYQNTIFLTLEST